METLRTMAGAQGQWSVVLCESQGRKAKKLLSPQPGKLAPLPLYRQGTVGDRPVLETLLYSLPGQPLVLDKSSLVLMQVSCDDVFLLWWKRQGLPVWPCVVFKLRDRGLVPPRELLASCRLGWPIWELSLAKGQDGAYWLLKLVGVEYLAAIKV